MFLNIVVKWKGSFILSLFWQQAFDAPISNTDIALKEYIEHHTGQDLL